MNIPSILPLLREDISIKSGGNDFKGSPTYLISDPIRGKFFHLGWKEYKIIKTWKAIRPEELVMELKDKYNLQLSIDELQSVYIFLRNNSLIKNFRNELKNFYDVKKKQSPNYIIWLMKNYLFFRLPLINPNNFLNITYDYVKFTLTSKFLVFMSLFAFFGLIMLSKQWDNFITTFSDFFSFDYIIPFIIAVLIAKVFHEFGHAYMCKKYSINVPSMGIAFLVLFPMLYTDTNESWKIKNPKHRIRVALAGVTVECYIAIIAMWLWMILPNGGVRSACFFLCTYSLITTFLINISPFLRFDGYHVLSDLISMRNLQTRSFALLRWKIRELLFGLNKQAPETFTSSKLRFLYTYAILTWLYRLVVFISIAFLVYYFFFKVLGIILFIVEIYYFILRPIINELKVWWGFKDNLRMNRNIVISGVILSIFILFLVIPWQSSISLPSTMSYQRQTLYTDIPAKVKKILVSNGSVVHENQILIELESPSLDFEINLIKNKISILKYQLRDTATYSNQLAKVKKLKSELNVYYSKLKNLEEKKERLLIVSPYDGEVTFISPKLYEGLWVANKQELVIVINNKLNHILALANNYEYKKLLVGEKGEFVPENLTLGKFDVTLSKITNYQINSLYENKNTNKSISWISSFPPLSAYHASQFGGSLASISEKNGSLVPENSLYRIYFNSSGYHFNKDISTVIKGKIFLDVYREPIVVRVWNYLTHFLVSESGF